MHGNGTTRTLVVAGVLVLASVAGAGLVAAEDFPSATDGDVSNGEELRAAEDDDDQVYEINYTFILENHQPGYVDGAAEHYATGLTENGTLYRIKLVSDDFGFSNCEPSDASAFGIDRGNNDPGTNTDKSLLTAFKTYTSEEDFIDIVYYRESQLAGEPVRGSVHDQIVAAQSNCYDNPSEPGWYRINGTITGHVDSDASGTDTDYVIRDLSQWVYVCDCSSRAEAEQTLGPPPRQDDDGGSDGDSGSGGSSTPTPTATPTSTPGSDADSGTVTATATPTPTLTATATPSNDGSGKAGATTPTATPGNGGAGGDGGTDTPVETAPATSAGGTDGGAADTATATVTATNGGTGAGGGSAADGVRTPTAGTGPGFGAAAAVAGLLGAGLLPLRRD
ncbi:hypothetical protein [Haloglomus litoreum]|uniref:hypothetical protein n=1 Tax=Haloglomus litoreum TaxID=3034026 RepID=UPI0023E843F0|nr:hypothetical protein [Haloglomus sp. DT116]